MKETDKEANTMEIRIHSNEINRMMKVIGQCTGPDGMNTANIEIIYDNNLLSIRGTNGQFSAVMSAPVMGGDGESFCVDGQTFARVAGICNGEMVIRTDEKACIIKGVGRTRIPIVPVKVAPFERVVGNSIRMRGGAFKDCYRMIQHAISVDGNRLQLTGAFLEREEGSEALRMVALDGFQLAIEDLACTGDKVKAIVPGGFMKLIASGLTETDDLRLTFDEKHIQAEAPGMLLKCALIAGEYVDYRRIIPADFATRCRVRLADLRNALRAGNAVNNKERLIRMDIGERTMTIQNNSVAAEFEANVDCDTEGDSVRIAFNEKYLMDLTGSIDAEEIDMGFNGPMSPVLVRWTDGRGTRLVLPVRVYG